MPSYNSTCNCIHPSPPNKKPVPPPPPSMAMATAHLLQITLMSLVTAAAASSPSLAMQPPPSLHNREMFMAVREMQRASYFSFVMLIKMVQDKLPSNSTFLMPSDRMLSRIFIPEDKVMEFLRRHSIPSPLLFDGLDHLPSGTLLPTYQSDYMIEVNNCGRRELYLNNVQLVRPNVCTAGFSFRCHGINGVMGVTTPQTPNCTGGAVPPPAAVGPSPAPLLLPPPPPSPTSVSPSPSVDVAPISPSPAAAFDDGTRKSSSCVINFSTSHAAIVPFLLVFSMVNNLI